MINETKLNQNLNKLSNRFKEINFDIIKSIYFDTNFDYNKAIKNINNLIKLNTNKTPNIKLYSNDNSFIKSLSSSSSTEDITDLEFSIVNLLPIGNKLLKEDTIINDLQQEFIMSNSSEI